MTTRLVVALASASLIVACGGDDGDDSGGQADAATQNDGGGGTPDANAGDAGPAFSDFLLPWICDSNAEVVYSFDADGQFNAECTTDPAWALNVAGTAMGTGPIPAFAQSLTFDGMNHYIDTAAVPLTLAGELTVDVWIYVDAVPSGNQVVVFAGDPLGTDRIFEIGAEAGGAITWTTYAADCTTPTTVRSNALAPSQWIHVRGLYDSGVTALYLNGFETAADTQADLCASATNGILSAGARNQSGISAYFAGEIDELRISSIAR